MFFLAYLNSLDTTFVERMCYIFNWLLKPIVKILFKFNRILPCSWVGTNKSLQSHFITRKAIVRNPILWRPPYFSNTVQPISSFLLSPIATPTALSVVLFLWLNGWSCHIRCTILLNDIMDLHMMTLCNLILEEPWWVLYETRCQVYWGMTHTTKTHNTQI